MLTAPAPLIGISSMHLLKTFINAENIKQETMLWPVLIHICFVASPSRWRGLAG